MIETLNKTAIDFYNDVSSGKIHNPKRSQVLQYTLWRAMANKGSIETDRNFWIEHDYLNHDYHPSVKLNILNIIIAKVVYLFFNKFIFS